MTSLLLYNWLLVVLQVAGEKESTDVCAWCSCVLSFALVLLMLMFVVMHDIMFYNPSPLQTTRYDYFFELFFMALVTFNACLWIFTPYASSYWCHKCCCFLFESKSSSSLDSNSITTTLVLGTVPVVIIITRTH